MDRFFRPGRPFYIKLAIGGFLLVPAANAVPCLLASPIFAMVGLVLGGFGLAHPDSFFDFVTSLVVVLGPLVAFIGCTGAIVQRRRGSLRTASGIQRRLVWAGAAALVLIAGTSAILGVPLSFSATSHSARSRSGRSTSRQRRSLIASTRSASPPSARRNSA